MRNSASSSTTSCWPTRTGSTLVTAGLPLGLADKLFLALDGAEEFDKDSRLVGRTDSAATATYHMRPFGRPQIEAYFAGSLADELEALCRTSVPSDLSAQAPPK